MLVDSPKVNSDAGLNTTCTEGSKELLTCGMYEVIESKLTIECQGLVWTPQEVDNDIV